MDLAAQIQQLEQFQGDGKQKVLTMYLNTDPADPEQQGGKWKINFKNTMRNFEKYLQESNDTAEMQRFQRIKQKVTDYMDQHELDLRKGVIIIATADEHIWFTVRVQVRLQTDIYWQETPVLDQLRAIKENYPKTGIILVQTNQVKIIESEMNEVEDTTVYELDMASEDWRRQHGTQKTKGDMQLGEHNLEADQFQNRYEANRYRWFKRIAPKLDKHAKAGAWEQIVVMGEADATNAVLEQMQKPVDIVMQKNMLDHEAHKVLDAVFGA